MANIRSADQNERMERLDQISNLVGNYLLRGFKMLAEECETCQTVLLEDRQKKLLCVGCDIVDKRPDNELPVSDNPPPSDPISNINTSEMSREQLYAMLSEQAAQKNKTEVTPTPPTRLSQAAEGVTESGPPTRLTSTAATGCTIVTDAISETVVDLCKAIQNSDHRNLSDSKQVVDYTEAIYNLTRSLVPSHNK